MDVVRALTTDPNNRVPHLAFRPDALTDVEVLTSDAFETAYFLSMNALDQPGVLADITRIFGDLKISIEALLQKEPLPGDETASIIILTQRTREKLMNQALQQIDALGSITNGVRRIRVEYLNGERT